MSDEAKKQALLNEYKGYLFEYLVALNLAIIYKIEAKFFQSITDDLRSMLRIQEDYVRENFPHLIRDLPVLAKDLAKSISKKIYSKNISEVILVGKMIAGSHISDFAEADIVIISDKKIYPISIKLSKANAFVNTKSGGVKSFLKKYFNSDLSFQLQSELNSFVDENFHKMAFELHEAAGLNYPMNFKEWVSAGLSELPGELDKDYKRILHSLYYQICEKLYEMLQELKSDNPEKFSASLMHLTGLGDKNLIQATCFYHLNNGNYKLDSNIVESAREIRDELKSGALIPYKKGLAHFEIRFLTRVLQIRIKPMNKFTSAAFKVNCSVGHL